MRERALLALMIVALAIVSAGCRTASATNMLTIACLTDTEAHALETEAIEPYRAGHPDAKISVTYLFHGDKLPADINTSLPDRVASELRGKADVYCGLPAECVRLLVEGHTIELLDPYVSRNPEVGATMACPVAAILRAEGSGRLYALAPTFVSMALAYNKDMFDAAGVDYPRGLMTWDEALALGAKVASAMPNETAAISFGPEGYSDFQTTFLHLAPSAGVYVMNNDGVSVDDRFSALWDFLMNAERRYALLKDGGAFWRGEAALALVYNGQVDDPNTFQSDPTFSRFRWDLAPSPVFDRVTPLSYAYIESTLVMSATSNHKDEAWNLMAYLAGPDYSAVLAGMMTPPFAGSLPSSETPLVLANLKNRADKNYGSFYAYAAPKTRAWSRTDIGCTYVTALLQRLVVDTVNGRIDGNDAASIINERGPGLYSSTVRIDISNPEALRRLIGY